MYKCMKCGEVFEEFGVYKNRVPYGISYVYEEFSVCPSCGDDNYAELKKCQICKEWEQEFSSSFENTCVKCVKDLISKYNALINMNFSEEEKNIIEAYMQGYEVL